MIKRFFILFLVLSVAGIPTKAQSFQSSHLQQAAKKLALDSTLLMQPGERMTDVKGQRLLIRVSDKAVVEHIGIPLFNKSLRAVLPSPIYDFLEYAVVNHKYHIQENDLLQQEIKFLKGSWQLLEQMSDTIPCTIDNIEEKNYKVTWQQDERDVVSVTFPVNYELLANSTRREMERNFVRDLRVFSASVNAPAPLPVDTSQLQPTSSQGLYLLKGDSYIIPAINDDLYYVKSAEGRPHLVLDNRYPVESLANMLVSPSASVEDVALDLRLSYSTYQTEKLSLSLRDFLAFCRQQGCKPYFGYERTEKGNVLGTLLMVNRKSGYDHILRVECPTGGLGNAMVIRAQIFLFTPSSNVKNLFAEKNTHSKSLIIWK